jgi:uncharacterized glyoxalase superfamily protein PhnB
MQDVRVVTVATDYDATVSFYQRVLGLAITGGWDDPDGRGTMFSVNGAKIEVLEANEHHPAVDPAGVVVAIEFDDVDQLYQRVHDAGVTIEETIGDRPWGERNFTLLAPNGLTLTAFETLQRL